MEINKAFITIGLATALLQMPVAADAQHAGSACCDHGNKTCRQNPLLQKSTLPFGAPDFARIKETDYLPAIEAAVKEQRENIQKIVDNKAKPTFANTILAYENSGVLLENVSNVFFGLCSAHKTPVIADTEKKVTPLLTDLDNEISFNQKLFERIKYVYDHEYKNLTGEDQRLTEVIYKGFVRSGAMLSADKMQRMKQINSRISDLQQQWGNLLPEATNNAVVWVDSKEKLDGLSDADIAQCKKDAESRGAKAPYCIVIINTTQQPILASLRNRDLRRQVYEASIHRADGTRPEFNTFAIVAEMARLRAEKGVFYAAQRVYGLQFKHRPDIPTYHPDMKVFEVSNADGSPLALFYCDYYRRPTKRGGAWMSAFAKQSRERHQLPIIYNVCNYAKAPEGQPSLLTWDEATTLFHEFGHALHGMLSDCRYNTLSGTAVARDFVEMPSQFNESFASIPEIFDHYVRHSVTGAPMPADLKKRMLESINFQTAYALGENLAATSVDMAWHLMKADEVPTADKAPLFESQALKKVGLLNAQIPPRYSTSYFNHVWGGGYAAGYYSYLWTEVLAVNIADYFAKHGALDPAVGKAFREKILSRGNTKDQMEMFTDFTGMTSPDASGLLKARGL